MTTDRAKHAASRLPDSFKGLFLQADGSQLIGDVDAKLTFLIVYIVLILLVVTDLSPFNDAAWPQQPIPEAAFHPGPHFQRQLHLAFLPHTTSRFEPERVVMSYLIRPALDTMAKAM